MGDAKKDPIQIFNYWGNIKDTKEMKMHDDVNAITERDYKLADSIDEVFENGP